MNYPLWEIPAPGLLIAFVAIVHVFISHFAVGGGLFLVVAEHKARRERDAALLDYLEKHSAFFVLLTLVGGAITGVGIWFTIGLIHPAATASLISAFVWGWAIEWTFFLVEIVAAMVYYFGWSRLPARVHLTVGWVYFAAAWLSLAVINAILAFMLTPGAWLTTRSFWDGVLNPTYVPSTIARTAASVGLAGLYAVLTATWLADARLKRQIARYAASRWVLPAAIVMPVAIAWYLAAAAAHGIPVNEVFGAKSRSIVEVFRAALSGSPAGYPPAQWALAATVIASIAVAALAAALLTRAGASYGRAYAAVMMAFGFVALGGAEWAREDLRKPYIISQYMYVNGIRTGSAPGDAFNAGAVATRGVLAASLWAKATPDGSAVEDQVVRGREVFRLSCSSCHTVDGYLAIRPLVRGASVGAATGTIARLASWRGRRMPPFIGTVEERHALAMYLATLGGATAEALAQSTAEAALGSRTFDEGCSLCHGPDAENPFQAKGRSPDALFDLIGKLPSIDDAMEPFEGGVEKRRALAEYLSTLDLQRTGGVR